jgi:hypothetical protein
VYLSNRLDLPALTIAAIYKQRCQIELFFKWLKQNLFIQHFFGNSLNAMKSQIWIAVCSYLLALIAHRPFRDQLSLRNFLHLVEVNMFEKITHHKDGFPTQFDPKNRIPLLYKQSCSDTVKTYRAVVKVSFRDSQFKVWRWR